MTLITHLRNEHNVEPEAIQAQFPEQALATGEFGAFLHDRNVNRVAGVLRYQIDVAGAAMTASFGIEHPLVPREDPTFVWTEPCRDVAEAVEHNERVFIYGPSGTGKSSLVRQIGALTQRPVRRVSLNGETSVGDFIGHWTVNERKETVFVKGILPQALEQGQILQLDEVDAMQPEVGFVLQQVLDRRDRSRRNRGACRSTQHELRVSRLHQGVGSHTADCSRWRARGGRVTEQSCRRNP